jgi:hypothetical protein
VGGSKGPALEDSRVKQMLSQKTNMHKTGLSRGESIFDVLDARREKWQAMSRCGMECVVWERVEGGSGSEGGSVDSRV